MLGCSGAREKNDMGVMMRVSICEFPGAYGSKILVSMNRFPDKPDMADFFPVLPQNFGFEGTLSKQRSSERVERNEEKEKERKSMIMERSKSETYEIKNSTERTTQ